MRIHTPSAISDVLSKKPKHRERKRSHKASLSTYEQLKDALRHRLTELKSEADDKRFATSSIDSSSKEVAQTRTYCRAARENLPADIFAYRLTGYLLHEARNGEHICLMANNSTAEWWKDMMVTHLPPTDGNPHARTVLVFPMIGYGANGIDIGFTKRTGRYVSRDVIKKINEECAEAVEFTFAEDGGCRELWLEEVEGATCGLIEDNEAFLGEWVVHMRADASPRK